jgi:TonB family protein
MFESNRVPPVPEVYTAEEVARAARVPDQHVRDLVRSGQIPTSRGFIAEDTAVRLVRVLTGRAPASTRDRSPLTLLVEARRRNGLGLASSTFLHATLVLALVLIPTLGWLSANDTEALVRKDEPVRLVFLTTPGPGGGGGGGGIKMPAPPPPAEREPPKPEPEKVSSPVPPVRRVATPPRLIRPRRPLVVEAPPAPPPDIEPPSFDLSHAIQAPVVPMPANKIDRLGLPMLATPTLADSLGPGTGGGVGSGQGLGLGEGLGGGIGPGFGGGTGGGPFRLGSGIEPPTLAREIRPDYTTEARRQGIEGDVVLEIVVRADGRVGNVQIVRSLGAGLSQKAVDAVRQWRFDPARRYGSPVDVVVTVSVEFSLR